MEVRKGYKRTEVGVIPEDWEVVELGGLGSWAGGGTPSKQNPNFWAGEIPWLSPKDIKRPLLKDSIDYITDIGLRNSSSKLIPKGSIVIVTRSGVLRHSFPASQVLVDMAINQDIKALEPSDSFDIKYVRYCLVGAEEKILKSCVKTGTTVESIDMRSFRKFLIPLPPTKAEQRAIATALSEVDAYVAALEALIAKKRQVKQGVMKEVLTPGEGWREVRLGDCLLCSPKYGINAPATTFNGNLPTYIRITDITENGKYDSSKKVSVRHPEASDYFLKKGDVVFARTGASVGKTYKYSSLDGELVYAGFLIKFSPDTEVLNPDYLFFYTQTKVYKKWVKVNSVRSGQPGINAGEFSNMTFSLPDPTEQIRIANLLTDLDEELTALENQLAKARAVKTGMLADLLTGRVRLV